MARGLYGCSEGNESRTGTAVMGDILSDNEICEGEVVAKWKSLYKNNALKALGAAYEATLADWINQGVPRYNAITRCQSMLNRAMCRKG